MKSFIQFLVTIIGGGVLLTVVPPILRLIHYKRRLRIVSNSNEYIAQSECGLLKVYIRLCEVLVGVVLAYWFLFQLIPFLIYGFYLCNSESGKAIMQSRNLNGWWFAIFHSISAFNNAGFSLLNDSMMVFQNDFLVQLVSTLQITAENTLFPVFLRY